MDEIRNKGYMAVKPYDNELEKFAKVF